MHLKTPCFQGRIGEQAYFYLAQQLVLLAFGVFLGSTHQFGQ
jgi:hypothetical protein